MNYADGQVPRVLIATALMLAPTYQVLMPGISRLQADREAAGRLADSILRAAAVVGTPLLLGLAAVASPLVPLLFGVHWADAVPVAQLLMLLGVRASMSTVQVAVVRGMGRPNWHLAGAAFGLAMTIALTTAAIEHGLLAVTAAVVVKAFLMWAPYAWLVCRLTDLTATQQAAAATGPTLAALIMAACVFAFVQWVGDQIPATATLALAIGLGAALYLAALAVFAPAAAAFVRAALATLARGDMKGLRALFAAG